MYQHVAAVTKRKRQAGHGALQQSSCSAHNTVQPPCLTPLHPACCRFSITGGIKFGAEYLVYPGDPALYHAQFTVRTLPWGAPLDPVLLKSIARGSHAARKHLLLATMRPAADGTGFVPYYISVAPQLGFGHQNQ